MNKEYDLEDVFLWPDGGWCYRFEFCYSNYGHRSDDYETLQYDTPEYNAFMEKINED